MKQSGNFSSNFNHMGDCQKGEAGAAEAGNAPQCAAAAKSSAAGASGTGISDAAAGASGTGISDAAAGASGTGISDAAGASRAGISDAAAGISGGAADLCQTAAEWRAGIWSKAKQQRSTAERRRAASCAVEGTAEPGRRAHEPADTSAAGTVQ